MTDDIPQTPRGRDRALFEAAQTGDAPRVEKLLQAGADPDAKGQRENYAPMIPALYAAVKAGHTRAAELLVAQGAKVDAGTPEGHTPLMAAVERGDAAVAALLLGAGAKWRLRYGPDTLLDLAERAPGNQPVLRLLLAKFDADALQDIFLDAAREAKPATLEVALSLGADAAARDHTGNTALILAAQNNQNPAAAQVVRLLLEKGAEIEAENDLQETALAAAMMRAPVPVENVRLLVAAGADITRMTLAGITVFEAAQLAGNEKILPCFESARKQNILREVRKYYEGTGNKITLRKPFNPRPPQ